MRHMTYDITKHSPKKHVIQKYDFFLYEMQIIIYKVNFLFVIFLVKTMLHSSEKLFFKFNM